MILGANSPTSALGVINANALTGFGVGSYNLITGPNAIVGGVPARFIRWIEPGEDPPAAMHAAT